MARHLRVHDPQALAQVAATLRAGAPVVLPTDTVYGLAALPTVPGATDRLFALKGRAADVPIAVLVAEIAQVEALAEIPSGARELAERHWPGPLTLVLARRAGIELSLGEPADTVGVRCPAHDLVRTVAAEVGPIATTSANRHGQPTPVTAGEAAEVLELPEDALVVDGGPCAGQPSTVLDVRGDRVRVLREGALDPSALVGDPDPGD